jgi:hypothetical protein
LLSVVTGTLFLVMITRSLSTSQFGLWEVIADVVVFASYPGGLLTYWATREVARGRIVGKTTIILNLLGSMIGAGIFIAFAFASFTAVNAGLAPFLLALVLVPLTYWNQSTTALVSGFDPGIGAYALLASEAAKLIVAYPLLFILKTNITGVIIAIAVSYLTLSAVSTVMLRPGTKDKVDFRLGQKWLRDSSVPAVYMLTYVVAVADTFVASLGQHFTTLAGYYQAAYQVAIIVGYAGYLSSALYPLQLRDRSEKLPSVLLDFSLLLAIPMAAGAIALAPKILYLLSPKYVVSSVVLVVLSLTQVFAVVSTIIDQSLMGRETVDLQTERKVAALLKSDLMFVPVANLTYLVIYQVAVFLIASAAVGSPEVYRFAAYWALAQMVLVVSVVVVKGKRLASKAKITLSRSVLVYLTTGAVMGLMVFIVGYPILQPDSGGIVYALRLALVIVIGAIFYFGIVSIVDRRVRGLLLSLLRMLRSTKSEERNIGLEDAAQ